MLFETRQYSYLMYVENEMQATAFGMHIRHRRETPYASEHGQHFQVPSPTGSAEASGNMLVPASG